MSATLHDIEKPKAKPIAYKRAHVAVDIVHGIAVAAGGMAITLFLLFILPFMQTMNKPPEADVVLQSVDTANIPPPPPPPEEKEEKKVENEKPPELTESAPPLDLSQLELALNPGGGFSQDWMGGDFAVKLNTAPGGDNKDVNALFSMADLDQQPRVLYQPGPLLNEQLRKKAPGTVYVLFVVDQNGRVEAPMVQKSTDSVFDASALAAVKQWKFEPGKRNGQPVRFRMRVPISYPKGA